MVIVFDLGGVLSSGGNRVAALAERVGVAPEALESRYWDGRASYDAGCSDLQYWRETLGPLGVAVDEGLADDLGRLDSLEWATLRPSARSLLAAAVASPHPVWLLSNAPTALARTLPDVDWARWLDGWVVSGACGVVKPAPGIYREVERGSGASGSELVFIDDRQENVAGAEALGWRAHLWVSDADTSDWLTDLGLLA